MNKLQDNDLSKERIRRIHCKGHEIAKSHITPYLQVLEKNNDFTKMEIAAALIILGFSAVHGTLRSKAHSLKVFSDLSRLSFFLILESQVPNDKRKSH